MALVGGKIYKTLAKTPAVLPGKRQAISDLFLSRSLEVDQLNWNLWPYLQHLASTLVSTWLAPHLGGLQPDTPIKEVLCILGLRYLSNDERRP